MGLQVSSSERLATTLTAGRLAYVLATMRRASCAMGGNPSQATTDASPAPAAALHEMRKLPIRSVGGTVREGIGKPLRAVTGAFPAPAAAPPEKL